jgi:flagellar FliL protein
MINSIENKNFLENENYPKNFKKRKKLILLAVGLILLIGIVIIILSFFQLIHFEIPFLGKKKANQQIKKQEIKKLGYIYTMDPIIVNLADQDFPRYLKIRIEMEGESLKAEEEIEKRLPQIKDAVISILSSKTFKEIYDKEGKNKLKEEIIQKTNQLLIKCKFKGIYFTEFVIQ